MTACNGMKPVDRPFVIYALDSDANALTRFQEDRVRPDLDIELVYLAGYQRLTLRMNMERLPGF
jgi:hypothetical protein